MLLGVVKAVEERFSLSFRTIVLDKFGFVWDHERLKNLQDEKWGVDSKGNLTVSFRLYNPVTLLFSNQHEKFRIRIYYLGFQRVELKFPPEEEDAPGELPIKPDYSRDKVQHTLPSGICISVTLKRSAGERELRHWVEIEARLDKAEPPC